MSKSNRAEVMGAFSLLSLGLLSLTGAAPSQACCMVPRDYTGHIGQSAQQAIVFWDRGREDLILKINYHITGTTMPGHFAWIISVPHEPDAYSVADPHLFEEIHPWAHRLTAPPSRSLGVMSGSAGIEAGLQLGQRVQVGPYDIQPVRAHGPAAFTALNAWRGPHGFPIEPAAHMAYFIKHGFTFLCIRVNPKSNQRAVDPTAGVVPLHLSFRTDRPYYPLKYSSRQGVFDVSLYIFTRDGLDYWSSRDSLSRINWADHGWRRKVPILVSNFPGVLKRLYETRAFGTRSGGPLWKLDVIDAAAVNGARPISRWTDDIFFGTGARLARR